MRRAAFGFAAIAVVSFCIGPFLWQVLTSLRPEGELTDLGLPSHFSIDSYVGAFVGRDFGQAILNSTLVASATTISALTIASLAAFAIAKLEFPGRRLLLAVALSISMFPPIATLSPLYLILRSLGLRDRLAGLVLPYTTFALPLALWVLHGFFRDIPDELYQSARLDGCSPFQAFRKVLLPLVAPGVATTAILVFIAAWNEFLYAMTFVSSPGKQTIPPAITMFSTEHLEPWGQIAAASVVTTLPLIAATLAFQRRIVAGLTAGAVKG